MNHFFARLKFNLVSLLLICLIVPQLLSAQHCGGFVNGPAILPRKQMPGAKVSSGMAYVPLKFHIIYGGGTAGANWYALDTGMADQAIDTVNTVFALAGIQFCKSGNLDLIYNDTFCNMDPYSLIYRFGPDYPDTSVIHIFIPVSFNGTLTAGISFQFANGRYGYAGPFNAVAIESNVRPNLHDQKYVLTHELGHYFGLYHTNNYTYNGDELVRRTNCDTTGDYCCSTPAEYGSFFVDTNCQLIPALTTTVDVYGDTLKPDPFNIMSDNLWSMGCRKYFSADQIDRIKYYYSTYLHELACPGTTGISETPDRYDPDVVLQPNPALTMQRLVFNMQTQQSLRVDLFDISGKKVGQVYDGMLTPGTSGIDCDVSALSPGVYYYRIQIGVTVLFRKMLHQ